MIIIVTIKNSPIFFQKTGAVENPDQIAKHRALCHAAVDFKFYI
jgi:hypothetical protein